MAIATELEHQYPHGVTVVYKSPESSLTAAEALPKAKAQTPNLNPTP